MSKIMPAKELTKCLKALAAAHAKAHLLRAKIADHCEEKYGCDPADIDCDNFIDSCDGGMGVAQGMTATEFHKAMVESLSIGSASC